MRAEKNFHALRTHDTILLNGTLGELPCPFNKEDLVQVGF
ncbi:hypothetical protein SAMN05660649_05023 [Desulfotomaculum arcticum]|uniref:Uncharacterized protein n=1 Tax=Desulfotruncus arcticus DSM 17038 TaxID=1121424 RepID=A0A1I2ZMW3_9FIRM|nr:hypothetical protein SAMN05660649_05023 [Desulfotomaculum arcticum] [Desulfotruncus arcticus DSM 17038]